MGSRKTGTRNFRMMKFGTPDLVDGPGSASTKPGLLEVGVPSGLRSGFRRRCLRLLPPRSAGALTPPVELLRRLRRVLFFLVGLCVDSCCSPLGDFGSGEVVVEGGSDGVVSVSVSDGVPGGTGV